MYRLLRRTFSFLPLGIEDGDALVEEGFRNDGFHLVEDPLAFRLQFPGPSAVRGLRVVGTTKALGGGITEEAFHGGIGEAGAVAGPVSLFVEEPRDGLLPPVLQEEFVKELPDGCLVRFVNERVVLPLVSEGGLAPQGFPELGSDGNGRRNAGSDLLPLPLGHRGDHGVEEAAGGGRGVDGFGKRDEVRIEFPEEFGEFEKLLRVSCEAGELREDESRDMAGTDVVEHPLGIG